jgi:tetratricopeptide (TPR) repeat protein
MKVRAVVLEPGEGDPDTAAFLRKYLDKAQSESGNYRVAAYADIGILAMHYNCLDIAEEALGRAASLGERLDVTVAKGPESAKFFKGEPHERALLWFYLGVHDYAGGDYENARACFRRAALQDALAEKSIDRGDWFAMDLLEAMADYCTRRIADEDLLRQMRARYLDRAANDKNATREDIEALLNMPCDADVVVIVTLGPPPRKIGYGTGGAQLGYQRQESKVSHVRMVASGKPLPVPVTDDTYVQAVTRGQRKADEVLQYEQQNKEMIEAGARGLQAIGQAGGTYGLPLTIVAHFLTEHAAQKDCSADTRQVQLLPGRILIWFGKKAEIGQSLSLEFYDADGKVIARTDPVTIPAAGNTVVLARYGG